MYWKLYFARFFKCLKRRKNNVENQKVKQVLIDLVIRVGKDRSLSDILSICHLGYLWVKVGCQVSRASKVQKAISLKGTGHTARDPYRLRETKTHSKTDYSG